MTSDPASTLDNPRRHAELDSGAMHEAVAGFADHLLKGLALARSVDWSQTQPTTPAGIAICGMGGSAIGGDLARLYWEHDAPMTVSVVRRYTLPAFINSHWYIVASSYSGNTGECLGMVEDARRRRCRTILVLSSGGRLAETARDNHWPQVILPAGMMPRAALGYSLGALLYVLAQWGVTGNDPRVLTGQIERSLGDAVGFLRECGRAWNQDIDLAENDAKKIAAGLAGRPVVVLGSNGSTDAVALRLKNQLCENGKAFALATILPESDHHEVVGFDSADPDMTRTAFVSLVSTDDHPAIDQQRTALVQILRARGHAVVEIHAKGDNRLARMLYLVHLGDFVSYYVAILNGRDPTPIAAIDRLKAALK